MFSNLRKHLVRTNQTESIGREVPIFICCHHKVGTVLMAQVFTAICQEFGWSFQKVFGKYEQEPLQADLVFFSHSLVDLNTIDTPYVGIHLIRDPRDIVVSGYSYHKRCQEEWCLNTNFELDSPIIYPQVPYSQEHRSEAWKRQYLSSLGGLSYQQTLCELPESEGILFEMRHYGAWTIESMLDWDYSNPNILEMHFETFMSDFDQSFREMFERFEFSDAQINQALRIAAVHDINRMTDEELRANPHISARETTKWKRYFKAEHKIAFKQLFGDVLVQLGYEDTDQW